MRPNFKFKFGWLIGLLFFVLSPPAQGQLPENFDFWRLLKQPGKWPRMKVTVTPNPVEICPGEEVTITVHVEILVKNPATEQDMWAPAAGLPFSLLVTQASPSGDALKSKGVDLYKTDAHGSFPVRVRHEPNLYDEQFHFITHAVQHEGQRSHFVRATVNIINLTKEECDKVKDPSPQGGDGDKDWIQKTDEKLKKGILEGGSPDKIKERLEELIKHLKAGKPGKHYTAGRVNAAVKELEALAQQKDKKRVAAAELEKVLEARNARFLELLERTGRPARHQDPTQAWLENLPGKSDAQLAALLRAAQAANDVLLRQVVVQLGQPPDYDQPLHLYPVLVIPKGGGDAFEGQMIMQVLHAKDNRVARVVCYDTDHGRISSLGVLRVPDRVRIELANRLPKADEARKKLLRELIAEAQKAQSRCVNGGNLIEAHATYRQRKLAGNEKGADEVRRQQLDRFFRQTAESLEKRDSGK